MLIDLSKVFDSMSSSGDTQYSIDHSLYIAEKELFLNFFKENPNSVICPTFLILKYYIHKLVSINIKPSVFYMSIKIQSTFTQIIN